MPEYEEVGMGANLGARTVRLRPGEAVVEATVEQEDGTIVVEASAVLALARVRRA